MAFNEPKPVLLKALTIQFKILKKQLNNTSVQSHYLAI